MKFKVLKPFYKSSQKTNYYINDVIELSKEESQGMLNEGYLEETKATEVTEKEIVAEAKEEVAFTISTKVTQEQVETLPKAKK